MSKVWVRWTEGKSGMAGTRPPVMWVGGCTGCDHTTQYWSWGASLGHMLEHQWIGCDGEKERSEHRRAKYAKLAAKRDTESQARLSCGGRTHGIMGEDQREVARRVDLPASMSPVPREPSLQRGQGQAATPLAIQNFGRGGFQLTAMAEWRRGT